MMPRVTFALACALFCIAGGLKVIDRKPDGASLSRLPAFVPKVAIGDKFGTSAAIGSQGLDTAYCGCNSSACNVDAVKVTKDLQNDLVLILGCSLDINAIEYFCTAIGSKVQKFQTRNPFSYLSHCDVGKFTLAYAFHPGAAPMPYFSEYAGTASAQLVVQNTVHDVQVQFGRQPTAVIVDSSLWDVSNWWEKKGRPKDPYPIPHADIATWCSRDVPNLLNWVQSSYPNSAIAYRTAPTVFADNGYGQTPQNIDAMVKCIETHKDPLNKLYGKFGFIDYHHFVDEVLKSAAGSGLKLYYKDSLHPGPSLSLMYMNKVLNWVRGMQK